MIRRIGCRSVRPRISRKQQTESVREFYIKELERAADTSNKQAQYEEMEEFIEKDFYKSRTMQELLFMYSKDSNLTHKVQAFESRSRRAFFKNEVMMKTIMKDYLLTSKKLGYNEYLIEILLKYMTLHYETKGDRALHGKDIAGDYFFDSSMYVEFKRDLLYMTLPAVEIEFNCLVSIITSLRKLKFKDYEIMNPLMYKLVLSVRNPDDAHLDQDFTNPYSINELLMFYQTDYGRHTKELEGTNETIKENLVEEFMKSKFNREEQDLMHTQMFAKIKKYLLGELTKKELMFNINFNKPSEFNFYEIFHQSSFANHVAKIHTLTQKEMLEEKKDSENVEIDKFIKESADENSFDNDLEFTDYLFEKIYGHISAFEKDNNTLLNSFKQLRKDFLELNSLQKDKFLTDNPEFLLEIIQFEETLIKLGLVLPSELDMFLNKKHRAESQFKVHDKNTHSRLDALIGDKSKLSPSLYEKKEQVMENYFKIKFGLDQNEDGKRLLELKRRIDHKDRFNENINVYEKARERTQKDFDFMHRLAKFQKCFALMEFMDFMRLNMSDSVDPAQNYIVEDFNLFFGFEKNSKQFFEEFSIAKRFKEINAEYHLVDEDHVKVAKYCYHKIFGEMQELIDFTLTGMSRQEFKVMDLMMMLGIYGKALLKEPTNIVAMKLGLAGKAIRAFNSSQSSVVSLKGKEGVVVRMIGYSQLIPDTQEIFAYDQSKGEVFVSLKACDDFFQDVQNLHSVPTMGFLNGLEFMPAELAAEFLATDVCSRICDNLVSSLTQDDMIYEAQCKVFSNLFQVKDVLEAFWFKVNGKGTQIHVRERDLGEIIQNNLKYLEQSVHKLFLHLLKEQKLVQFTSKGGKRPLPVCSFHNYIFKILFYLEKYYPSSYDQLLKENSSFIKNQLKLIQSQCFSFSALDHSFSIKNDPIRRLTMGAVLSSISKGEKSHFKTTIMNNHLLPFLCPDSFIVSDGQLKAVYVSPVEGFNPDCVGNLSKTEMLRHIFQKNFGSEMIAKFVSVQDFAMDPYFYRTFNFQFQSDPDYLQAMAQNIMLTKTQFFPQIDLILNEKGINRFKELPLDLASVKQNLTDLYFQEITKLWNQKDFLNVFDHIDEMFVIFNKSVADFDQEQFLSKVKQLYFLVVTLQIKLTQKSSQSDFQLESENKTKLQESVNVLKTFLQNEQAKEEVQQRKEFDIFGKRVITDCFAVPYNRNLPHGKEPTLENNRDYLLERGVDHPLLNNKENWKFELLNYKLFSNGEYFVMEDIKQYFEKDLPSTQYMKNTDKLIMTDFTTNARFVTPSIHRRSLKKSLGVSMNWDSLVYQTSASKKNEALYLDELAYKHHDKMEKEFSPNESFKIGMMNMLWDLKLSNNPAKDLTLILGCDFWKNIPSKADLKGPLPSLDFDIEAYNKALFSSHSKESYYTLKFDHLRDKNKELEKWQHFVKVKIPDIYSKTEDPITKKEISKFWEYAKRKYAQMVKDYKNKVVKKDSYYKNADVKDFERKIVSDNEKDYNRQAKEIPGSQRLLQNELDVRLFAQNNLLKMSLYLNQRESNSADPDLYSFWQSKIGSEVFDDFIQLNDSIWEMPIESVFSEKDFQVFDQVFPHLRIRSFKDFQISDLLVYLNLAVSPWFIDTIEKLHFAKNIQQEDPLVCVESVLNLEAPVINNVSRFLSLYIDNYMNIIATSLKPVEQVSMKEIYGFRKEFETNLIWTKADLQSFDDLLQDMPHLLNPIEGIRLWIERKEKESRKRNSVNMEQISELTLPDKQLQPFFRNIIEKRNERLAQQLFKKPYSDIRVDELTRLVDHLIERVYLFKRNMPFNFHETVHFVMNHPNLHHADYINMFEIFNLFHININDLAYEELLTEYPVVFNDSCLISNRFSKLSKDELLAMSDMVDCSLESIYLK